MIITSEPSHTAPNHDETFIRALSSITRDQVHAIEQTVRESVRQWHVGAIPDYDGYTSILIEAAGRNDEQAAFFISGTKQRLELFETRDDHLTLLDVFPTVSLLAVRLAGLIGPMGG